MTFTPKFKVGERYFTKEPEPRVVHVLGQCLIDPDLYVCRPEGMKTSVLMNCGSPFDGKIIGTEIFLDEASALEGPMSLGISRGESQPVFDDDYEGVGCCNCDGGWKHGCCDDLCYACNEAAWCENAISCRTCNPHGDFNP